MTIAETVNPITHNWAVEDLMIKDHNEPTDIEFKLDSVMVDTRFKFNLKKRIIDKYGETEETINICQFDMKIEGIYGIESEEPIEVSKEAKKDLHDKLYGIIWDEIESYYRIKL